MCDACVNLARSFAAWEVRLYLDTHPEDASALALYRRLCAQECGGYACVPHERDRWSWIDDPWPWELEANLPGKEA